MTPSHLSTKKRTYRRLYNPLSLTKEGMRFQDEFIEAIRPVIAKWAKPRRRVDSRDMESIAHHAVNWHLCWVHIERQPLVVRRRRKK